MVRCDRLSFCLPIPAQCSTRGGAYSFSRYPYVSLFLTSPERASSQFYLARALPFHPVAYLIVDRGYECVHLVNSECLNYLGDG